MTLKARPSLPQRMSFLCRRGRWRRSRDPRGGGGYFGKRLSGSAALTMKQRLPPAQIAAKPTMRYRAGEADNQLD